MKKNEECEKNVLEVHESLHNLTICNECTTPHLRGWVGDSRANRWGSDLSSAPTVTGKCRACDITQIYPRGIYYYKEQGYDSQQVPAVQGF